MTMHSARVTAQWRQGGQREHGYNVGVVCGINESSHLADGEWMGYVKDGDVQWPFILRGGSTCFYGGDEPKSEQTNFGAKPIQVGEMFTLSSWEPGEGPFTYEITSCHLY